MKARSALRWLVHLLRARAACLLRLHALRVAWHVFRYRIAPYFAWPFGFLRSHRQCVTVWPSAIPTLAPRVALFCHFDAQGEVRADVLRYLATLRDAGFSVVVVSNSGALHPAAMAELQALCVSVLVRRNVGYDFCAWREALERLQLPRPNTELVLLANDSVYGPLQPLAPVLARFAADGADVWGLTGSDQIRFHLQSYFLAAGPAALRSAAWRRFWRSVRPVPSKHLMIRLYEVGLTQRLLRAGLRCEALWPLTALQPPRDTATVNPTHDMWRRLLDAGFPFIKRELVRDNPSGVPDASEWRDVVAAIDNVTAAEIEQDLYRGRAMSA